jgi:hypothetical protein
VSFFAVTLLQLPPMLLIDLHPATHLLLIFTVLAVVHSSEMLPRGLIFVLKFAAVTHRHRPLARGLLIFAFLAVKHSSEMLPRGLIVAVEFAAVAPRRRGLLAAGLVVVVIVAVVEHHGDLLREPPQPLLSPLFSLLALLVTVTVSLQVRLIRCICRTRTAPPRHR